MKCVIFTQRVEMIESYQERRDCADQRISDLIRTCGFLPVPLPNASGLAESYIDSLKPAGIILTGGNSLVKYGGNAAERDKMDAALIRLAVQRQLPLYGFCRGMQSVLDYFGSALVQVDGHVAVRHTVTGENESFEVNSYHTQACIELSHDSPLKVSKRAGDGVIEEIYHKTLPIRATMWHPEREQPYNERDLSNIRRLFS